MKIKEMKQKTVNFVKENKEIVALDCAALIFGGGMFILGRKIGFKSGAEATAKYCRDDIQAGRFLNGLERGSGNYLRERFRNEELLNGAVNPFKEAIKYLSDPKNTENVCGIVVLRKEND